MKFRVAISCLVITLLLGVGCAGSPTDPMGRENSLEQSQRRFTQLVRWGELERASAFVDEPMREDFLAHADDFEDLRITDFTTGTPDYGDDKTRATVKVTYHVFSLRTFAEKKIRETQEWYRDEGLGNTWSVRPQTELLIASFN